MLPSAVPPPMTGGGKMAAREVPPLRPQLPVDCDQAVTDGDAAVWRDPNTVPFDLASRGGT